MTEHQTEDYLIFSWMFQICFHLNTGAELKQWYIYFHNTASEKW